MSHDELTMRKAAKAVTGGHPSNLDDLIDRAAQALADNMRTGYTRRYEYALAEQVLAVFVDDNPDWTALDQMVHGAVHDLIFGSALLHETETSSYDTASAMAEALTTTIREQDRVQWSVEQLVTSQIVDRADLLRQEAAR